MMSSSAPLKPVDHPLRARILGEIHSRPFHPISAPRRVLRFGFLTDALAVKTTCQAIAAYCAKHGVAPPQEGAKHHRAQLPGFDLTFEAHGEFTTLTWSFPCADAVMPFAPPPAAHDIPWGDVPPPGPVLVAIDCHVVKGKATDIELHTVFDRTSLALASASHGRAVIATDFRADHNGFVRILIVDEGMEERATGALTQRVLEIETYRTFSLLGLPEAQAQAPSILAIEQELPRIMAQMKTSDRAADSQLLLDRLTALAAELEEGAAASQFRFGATRAYAEIMNARFESIAERKIEGFSSWSGFLARRFKPAMRTCATLEERQANLSRKLARAAQLLRTKVDIDLEKQNKELLEAMNERSRLSLQLQQTVEGLSVAAISYYIIGLVGYAVKGLEKIGWPLDSSLTIALSVPLVILLVWWMVRRIRNRQGH